MQAFVPKNRKPKFELTFKIIDLNNVPLVSGNCYIKWHIPSSTSAEHRGRTPKLPIKDHKVIWDYEKATQVRLTADKHSVLQYTEIYFEILQEYSAGARGERIPLGHIKINLAEYAYVEGDDGEEGITRRYLMQESKINSTLKMSICMKQIEGERIFVAPPLRTAPIFGGIAGIITSEQGDPDDAGNVPSMSSKLSRDNGEIQDLYRKALAASWSCMLDELLADKCIEDIFSGGDGWGAKAAASTQSVASSPKPESSPADEQESDKETTSQRPGHKWTPASFIRTVHVKPKGHRRTASKDSTVNLKPGGEVEREHQDPPASPRNSDEQKQEPKTPRNEVSDFSVREDLRDWHVGSPK